MHQITVDGRWTTVSTPALDLLDPVLSCDGPILNLLEPDRVIRFGRFRSYEVIDGALHTLTGFVPRNRKTLTAAGRSVTLLSRDTHDERSLPATQVIEAISGSSRRYANVLATERQAQLVMPSALQPQVITLAAQVYPKARILVVVRNRRRRETWLRRLQEHFQYAGWDRHSNVRR
jgi:hypothetical protein